MVCVLSRSRIIIHILCDVNSFWRVAWGWRVWKKTRFLGRNKKKTMSISPRLFLVPHRRCWALSKTQRTKCGEILMSIERWGKMDREDNTSNVKISILFADLVCCLIRCQTKKQFHCKLFPFVDSLLAPYLVCLYSSSCSHTLEKRRWSSLQIALINCRSRLLLAAHNLFCYVRCADEFV